MSEIAKEVAYDVSTFGAAGDTSPSIAMEQLQEVDISLSGTFSATIKVERSLDGGTTWDELQSWTAPNHYRHQAGAGQLIRARCSSYTSGTPKTIIKKGS